jgi:hypothetical protein
VHSQHWHQSMATANCAVPVQVGRSDTAIKAETTSQTAGLAGLPKAVTGSAFKAPRRSF